MARPRGLSRTLNRIYWFVAMRPHGVTKAEIFDYLYGDDPDGGPFDKIIDIHICHLNSILSKSGLIICRLIKRKHGLPYQLRRLDNGHIWLPVQTDLTL